MQFHSRAKAKLSVFSLWLFRWCCSGSGTGASSPRVSPPPSLVFTCRIQDPTQTEPWMMGHYFSVPDIGEIQGYFSSFSKEDILPQRCFRVRILGGWVRRHVYFLHLLGKTCSLSSYLERVYPKHISC